MRISIVTVTEGSVDALRCTIASVEEQSHEDLEHILVINKKDCELESAISALHHPDMIVLCEYDASHTASLCAGLRRTTGSVVTIMPPGTKFPGSRYLSHVENAFLTSGLSDLHVKLNEGPIFWRRNSIPEDLVSA